MPTQQQVRAAVQTYVESFNHTDKAGFLETLAPTVELVDPVGSPSRTGKDALAGFWDAIFGVCTAVTIEQRSLFVTGDEAALLFHTIQQRKDGTELALDGVDVFRVDDAGKLATIRGYSDADHTRLVPDGRVPATVSFRGKIGVLTEEHFDETEYHRFADFFPAHGYQIDYITRLWGNPQLTFNGNDFTSQVTVSIDIDSVRPTDYQGIILMGGYAMDRLRYEESPHQGQPNHAPAVNFLRHAVAAMDAGQLRIGTICHALWLFCAAPELILGRHVTCAHNILYDVQNAGGVVVFDGDETAVTHVDGGLITGRHPGVVDEFMACFLQELDRAQAPSESRVASPSA